MTTRVPSGSWVSSCVEPSIIVILHGVPCSCNDFRQAAQPPVPSTRVLEHQQQLSKIMEKLFGPSRFARNPSMVAWPYP